MSDAEGRHFRRVATHGLRINENLVCRSLAEILSSSTRCSQRKAANPTSTTTPSRHRLAASALLRQLQLREATLVRPLYQWQAWGVKLPNRCPQCLNAFLGVNPIRE